MWYIRREAIKCPLLTILVVILIIALSPVYFFSIPQTYSNPSYFNLLARCTNCEKATIAAVEDFRKGNYQVVTWGLSTEFSSNLADILERDYRIKTVFGGCIGNEEVKCYDKEMRRLLLSKLGDKFYRIAYDEAVKRRQ